MSDFRVDKNEAGMVWVNCPRCGQAVIPSYNGFRRHDEFCEGAAIGALIRMHWPDGRSLVGPFTAR